MGAKFERRAKEHRARALACASASELRWGVKGWRRLREGQMKDQIPPARLTSSVRAHIENGRPARGLYPQMGSARIRRRVLELCWPECAQWPHAR